MLQGSSMWPSSCYEMLMYARMPKAKLHLEGKPDWLRIPIVSRGSKHHPTQKPIELLQELLKRVAIPGQTLYDPFSGSASSLIAGIKEKLKVLGCELDKNFGFQDLLFGIKIIIKDMGWVVISPSVHANTIELTVEGLNPQKSEELMSLATKCVENCQN